MEGDTKGEYWSLETPGERLGIVSRRSSNSLVGDAMFPWVADLYDRRGRKFRWDRFMGLEEAKRWVVERLGVLEDRELK